jgi:hypothetical protein
MSRCLRTPGFRILNDEDFDELRALRRAVTTLELNSVGIDVCLSDKRDLDEEHS